MVTDTTHTIHRRPAQRFHHIHDARARPPGCQVKSAFVAIRATAAVTGNLGKNQARIQLPKQLILQLILRQLAGIKIHHQHVCLLNQVVHDCLPLSLFQVQCQGTLAPRGQLPVVIRAMAGGKTAIAVALGRLNFNDISTKIRHYCGGRRPRHIRRCVNHPKPCQYQCHTLIPGNVPL